MTRRQFLNYLAHDTTRIRRAYSKDGKQMVTYYVQVFYWKEEHRWIR